MVSSEMLAVSPSSSSCIENDERERDEETTTTVDSKNNSNASIIAISRAKNKNNNNNNDKGFANNNRMARSTSSMMVVIMMIALVVAVTYNTTTTTTAANNAAGNHNNDSSASFQIDNADVVVGDDVPKNKRRRKLSSLERLLESEESEDALVAKIADKLKPSAIKFEGENEGNKGGENGEVETIRIVDKEKRMMVPHQFLHLHHMKTGGTSIDHLLRCAMSRLKGQNPKKLWSSPKDIDYSKGYFDVPYYSIHECSRSRFTQCLTDETNNCRDRMNKAAVMSYCGALKYLDEFGWWENNNADQNIKAFTVLRNPVDRVWSMFRFQTKNCYQCTPLKDIYKSIDDGTMKDTLNLDKLCLDQIQNHEVANLLSSEWSMDVTEFANDDDDTDSKKQEMKDEMIQEAINNMKNFFTVIGITEELVETASIIGTVIPWMNETIAMEEEETTATPSDDDEKKKQKKGKQKDDDDETTCLLPHANASPKNNRCGESGTHWDLPDKPDQETYDLIAKHNSMDMELYEAAVKYFELQMRALNK